MNGDCPAAGERAHHPRASSTHPTLRSERLLLRPLCGPDAVAIATHAGDRRVADQLLHVPSPYPVALARRWLDRRLAWWEQYRGVTLAIALLSRPRMLIGTVCLRQHVRDGRAELGYWLGPAYWQRGLASEATRTLVGFGFQQLGLARIYAEVLIHNHASRRVLDKLAMVHEGTKRRHVRKGDQLYDVACYGLLREEWR